MWFSWVAGYPSAARHDVQPQEQQVGSLLPSTLSQFLEVATMLLFAIQVPSEQKHPDHSKGLVSLCILALYTPKRASTWSPSGCSY